MITKTRKQGNSIMLTVPKEFHIPNGVEVEAKLVDNGVLYEFVEDKKDFFDFSEDILQDIIADGYQGTDILTEFKNRKAKILANLKSVADKTVAEEKPMTEEELSAEIGL